MLNQKILFRAALARNAALAPAASIASSDYEDGTFRIAGSATAMVICGCLALLGLVALTTAF
jgi:hypothetical protein